MLIRFAILPLLGLFLLVGCRGDKCGRSFWQRLQGTPCPSKVAEAVVEPCLGLNPDGCDGTLDREVVWTGSYTLPVSSSKQAIQDFRVFYRFHPDTSYEQALFVTIEGHKLMEKRSGHYELSGSGLELRLESSTCEGMQSLFSYFDRAKAAFLVYRDRNQLATLGLVMPESVEALVGAMAVWLDGLSKALTRGSFGPFVGGYFAALLKLFEYSFTGEFWLQVTTGKLEYASTNAATYESLAAKAYSGCMSEAGLASFIAGAFIPAPPP